MVQDRAGKVETSGVETSVLNVVGSNLSRSDAVGHDSTWSRMFQDSTPAGQCSLQTVS